MRGSARIIHRKNVLPTYGNKIKANQWNITSSSSSVSKRLFQIIIKHPNISNRNDIESYFGIITLLTARFLRKNNKK